MKPSHPNYTQGALNDPDCGRVWSRPLFWGLLQRRSMRWFHLLEAHASSAFVAAVRHSLTGDFEVTKATAESSLVAAALCFRL